MDVILRTDDKSGGRRSGGHRRSRSLLVHPQHQHSRPGRRQVPGPRPQHQPDELQQTTRQSLGGELWILFQHPLVM